MSLVEVGDSYIASTQLVDVTNTPPATNKVTCTITLPDSTTVGPFAVTSTTPGTFTYTYVTSQAGMHSAVFTSTDTNPAVARTDFYVYPVSRGLVTLAEVKTELKIKPDNTAYDDQLQQWIKASRTLIEEFVGPLVGKTIDDWYDGGSRTIALTAVPLISVTSVVETYGVGVVRTLTGQILDVGSGTGAYAYTVDLAAAIVTRRVNGLAAPFAPGRRNIHIVAVAGVAGAWNENIRLANLELMRTWWAATQSMVRPQSLSGASSSGEDMSAQAIGYYLPPRVMKMLGYDARPPGLA